MKACRDGYGDALESIGSNKKIVALSADLSISTKQTKFRDKYPERFVEVGIAEQNLVTVASGLAHVGKIPFASSFGAFSPGRNWEQIRTTIAYNNNNVKIVSTHCGLDVGPDGATHQVLEDIAMMRALPNMKVIVPLDYNQAFLATKELAKVKGPCYMRMGRSKIEEITSKKDKFEIGKAQILKSGKDIAIIGCGSLLVKALEASLMTKKSVAVINMHTIKPLDTKTILKFAKKVKGIITLEDHQTSGGLGSAVSEYLSENYPTKIIKMGVKDSFGESGDVEELYKKHKLTTEDIVKNIAKF